MLFLSVCVMADNSSVNGVQTSDGLASDEKAHHYTYLKDFRTKQCPDFLQHKCTQHRPFTCFNWHFANQKRRRPVRRKDGTFNYSADVYCTKYDETTGLCPDGDECPLLHRTAGDTERRYHIRYYKTCPCVYETDSKGNCSRNGPHCAFAHGIADLRKPVYDVRELESTQSNSSPSAIVDTPLAASLESDRLLNEDPVWNDPKYVLTNYKTEFCRRPLRLCRQGYACPSYHNPRDKRRSPAKFKYRSTPCPNVKQGDEWGDPSKCENGDMCGYCHTRTEQQFHLEIYKSTKCNDMVQTGYCPRGLFCAFAHVEQEMNMQWDVGFPNSSLAAYVDDALAPLTNGSKKDDFLLQSELKMLAPGEERARRNTMPSIPSNAELFIRTSEGSGFVLNSAVASRIAAANDMGSPRIGTWGVPDPPAPLPPSGPTAAALSSSLNDSFLQSYALRSSGLAEPPQGRMMRPGASMSFGSYQQYQQYRESLRQATGSGGDVNNALAARMSLLAQLQAAGGAANVGGLPASFYTTTTPPAFPMAGTGMQLPQSFFGSQDSVGRPAVSSREDDLDLNLDDLKLESLDEPAEQSAPVTLFGTGAGFSPSAAAAFANPAMMPDSNGGMPVSCRMMAMPPLTNGCANLPIRPLAAVPGQGLTPQQMQYQQQLQQQQQEMAASSMFAHPPPGLPPPAAASGMVPPQSTTIGPGATQDEIIRLHHELMAKKQAIMRWEEGMKQAYNACEAWKSEAEKQERLLRQVEDERNKAFMTRDSMVGRLQTLCQVAEMQHELEMFGGGSASAAAGGGGAGRPVTAPQQVLHSLQRDVDYQQLPLNTVHQLHANIRHDFEMVEQMIRNLGVCMSCMERRATVSVIPCAHVSLCYVCAANATECPQCGVAIAPRSPAQVSPPIM